MNIKLILDKITCITHQFIFALLNLKVVIFLTETRNYFVPAYSWVQLEVKNQELFSAAGVVILELEIE